MRDLDLFSTFLYWNTNIFHCPTVFLQSVLPPFQGYIFGPLCLSGKRVYPEPVSDQRAGSIWASFLPDVYAYDLQT